MESRNLKTVNQMVDTHGFLTSGGLRHLIFKSDINGMDELNVVLRMGRKVLIDEDKFFKWLRNKND